MRPRDEAPRDGPRSFEPALKSAARAIPHVGRIGPSGVIPAPGSPDRGVYWLRAPSWLFGGETEDPVWVEFPSRAAAAAERRSCVVRWAFRELTGQALDPMDARVPRAGEEWRALKQVFSRGRRPSSGGEAPD